MLENLILFGVYVIEAVKYCLGAYVVFREKVERKWLYVVGGMIMLAYLFMIQPLEKKNSLAVWGIIISATFINMTGKIKEKLIQTLLLVVLLVNIDATITACTKQISDHLWRVGYSQIFLDCLWGLVILCFLFLLKKNKVYIKRFFPKKNAIYFIVLFCGVLLAFTVESLNFATDYVANEAFRIFSAVVVSVSYVGVCLLCWLLLYLRNRNEETDTLLQMEKIFNEKQANHYRKLLQKEEETRRFRHDIKNHLICLNMLASNQKFSELTKYLKRMNANMEKAETVKYYTGNELLDIILNEKLSSCGNDVDIWVQGKVGEHICIDEMDLCVIVTNLLDNALEAVGKIKDGKKMIHIKILMGKRWMELSIANSVKGEAHFGSDGLPVTTKEDKRIHGLGLKNVKRTIENYDGELTCTMEDGMFVSKIFLPYDSHLRS